MANSQTLVPINPMVTSDSQEPWKGLEIAFQRAIDHLNAVPTRPPKPQASYADQRESFSEDLP
jgi:hypothetical protein